MAGGEQLLCDLGSGEYAKDYFGAKRYDYLVNSSRGHSAPVIEGLYQREGPKAEVLSVERTEEKDEITLEISSAYQAASLKSFRRNICIRKKEASVTVQDSCSFTGDSLSVTERFVSMIEPEREPNGDIRICGKTGSVVLSGSGQCEALAISKEEFRKPGGQTGMAWFIDYPVLLHRDSEGFCLHILITGADAKGGGLLE
nr:heparinase II/III family protein [uncultured Acetatifactor sp.]